MVGPLVAMQMKKNRLDPETAELKKVFRIATQQDLDRFEEARKREHATMIRSRVIAEDLGLNMKIGDVEFQGDGSKAIFYYISDERVDFRKLIRLLADEFHVRIEMKQIGARQEAGRIGGIGPCGRPLCCSSWMTHFVSVGTGAARLQDLSMNPQKLAGQCAKLKCCLNFEIDSYAESAKKLPGRDVVLETKDGDFHYFKADILQRLITYSSDKRVPANLTTISAARAFEIIALNKQGIKVDRLLPDQEGGEQQKEYIDLTDQDSLTRFDRTKPKKNKKQPEKKQAPEKKQQPDKKQTADKKQPDKKQPAKPKGSQPAAKQSKGEGNVQKPKNVQPPKPKGAEAPQSAQTADRKPKGRPNRHPKNRKNTPQNEQ